MTRFILILLSSLSTALAGLKEDAEEQILNWSKNPAHLSGNQFQYDYKIWTIPDSLQKKAGSKANKPFFRDKIEVWRIRDGSKVLAFAVLDHTVAKVKPISFLALYNLQGQLITSEVIKYRESHGDKVCRPKWLAQFRGKKAGDSWVVGKDIDGISGATLSVHSMTQALHRLAWLAPYYPKVFGAH